MTHLFGSDQTHQSIVSGILATVSTELADFLVE